MVLEFLQHLVNGVSMGSIYALIALGYTMVFGVLKLINFAHGEVYMVGAFVGFYSISLFDLRSHPSVWALLLILVCAMVVTALLGYGVERFAYRPLRKAPRINLLITAIGVSLLLQHTGQLFFGADPKFFPQIYRPDFDLSWGELKVNSLQVVVFVISFLLMGLLHYVIFHTRTGRAMRAVSFNHDLAGLMGIHTHKVISLTFMLGSALAGAAGVLVGLAYPRIDPMMGTMPGLKAFVAAVLGGIGNIQGAMAGALILGLSEELLVGYWLPTFRDALAFGLLILILLIKPAGLLGTKRAEKV